MYVTKLHCILLATIVKDGYLLVTIYYIVTALSSNLNH